MVKYIINKKMIGLKQSTTNTNQVLNHLTKQRTTGLLVNAPKRLYQL